MTAPEPTQAGAPDAAAPPAPAAAPPDPGELLRSRPYVMLLVFAAVMGPIVSTIAFAFLQLVSVAQKGIFDHLPNALGFNGEPVWWPLPVVALAGVVVAPIIKYLPGRGGHSPADGFSAGGTAPNILPGVILAAVATLALGVVLGPEAPLIAIGSGSAALLVLLVQRQASGSDLQVVGAAGAMAALATIVGSPLVAALFMLEAIGLGGPLLTVVILPGLVAAGTGALMFVGLGSWTGLGTFTLAIPNLPPAARPDVAEIGWAIAFGLAAAVAAAAIHWGAVWLRGRVEPRMLSTMPIVGLAVGGLAVIYAETTGRGTSDVLFSGQSLIGPLVQHAATWSVTALVILVVLKGVAYSMSLSSFRGGPIFPSLLIGAAAGVAGSHLPGMQLVPAVGIGMGAMCCAMLRLPVSSVALPTVLLFHDGVDITPLVIVAVVVAYVAVSRLAPRPSASLTRPAEAQAA